MDEAEGLCDKLAIMINGKFACYGSPSYLKSEYGQGYTFNIKHLDQNEQIQKFIA
jgi:ABC-type multidrug transport system ATPase subunit